MDKLSWTDLRKTIAQRINTDEKEVATFLNALVPSITKALQEDRQVRITSFGTFKLQSIAPRKSVNVSTGETFTLPGYDKLTFSPESSIRELIGNLNATNIDGEAPSNAEVKPSPVDDNSVPLRKLSEQASEIVDILNDLGQNPNDSEQKTTEPKQVPTENDTTLTDSQPTVNPDSTLTQPTVETPIETPVEAPVIEPQNTEINVNEEQPEKKKCRTWLVVGITVLIFALLLAAAFLFLGNRFMTWVESLKNKGQQIEQVEQLPDGPIIVGDTIAENGQPQSTLPYPIEYKEFIAKERLPHGSRLAWLARKYYGERELWVFIYEANQKVIDHPSVIPVGTLIRIPKLPEPLMDYSNPEVKELVDRLAAEYKQR